MQSQKKMLWHRFLTHYQAFNMRWLDRITSLGRIIALKSFRFNISDSSGFVKLKVNQEGMAGSLA